MYRYCTYRYCTPGRGPGPGNHLRYTAYRPDPINMQWHRRGATSLPPPVHPAVALRRTSSCAPSIPIILVGRRHRAQPQPQGTLVPNMPPTDQPGGCHAPLGRAPHPRETTPLAYMECRRDDRCDPNDTTIDPGTPSISFRHPPNRRLPACHAAHTPPHRCRTPRNASANSSRRSETPARNRHSSSQTRSRHLPRALLRSSCLPVGGPGAFASVAGSARFFQRRLGEPIIHTVYLFPKRSRVGPRP
jgi:hypothetical protein